MLQMFRAEDRGSGELRIEAVRLLRLSSSPQGKNAMSGYLTLPLLEASLDRLPAARSLALARRQIEALFGHNDVANPRLKRFAKGHNCVIAHADDCVVFHKLPPRH